MLPTKARFGGSQHEENERLSRRNFWLILVVTAIMLTAFPFLVRPFSQQSNDNSPSPQPFTFFILPETSTFSEPTIPILVAVILPSELSQNFSKLPTLRFLRHLGRSFSLNFPFA
jgi:Na+/proline symporter